MKLSRKRTFHRLVVGVIPQLLFSTRAFSPSSRTSVQFYNLQQHISSFHCRERPHRCSHEGCSATFATKVSTSFLFSFFSLFLSLFLSFVCLIHCYVVVSALTRLHVLSGACSPDTARCHLISIATVFVCVFHVNLMYSCTHLMCYNNRRVCIIFVLSTILM